MAATTRSLVSQLLGPGTRPVPGCLYDFAVLAGWHADRVARAAAGGGGGRRHGGGGGGGGAAAPAGGGGAASGGGGGPPPLLVVLEDAERFAPDVLNDLVYLCSKARA